MNKEALARKRKSVRTRVTKLITEAEEKLTAEANSEGLEQTLEGIKAVSNMLKDVNGQLELFVDEDHAEEEYEKVLDYELKISDIVSKLNSKIRTMQQQPQQRTQQREYSDVRNGNGHTSGTTKLPKLELIKFDGSKGTWQRFWHQFSTSIDESHALSTMEKFNYLMAAVKGAAAEVIEGLQFAEANYSKAIQMLKRRFGREEELIEQHMNGMWDITQVSSARDIEGLRRMYNRLQVHMRGLESLGINETSYASMLLPLILRALPARMRTDFRLKEEETQATTQGRGQEQAEVTSKDKMRRLMEYIDRQVKCQELDNEGAPHKKVQATGSKTFPKMSAAALASMSYERKCVFCHQSTHEAPNCQRSMPLEEKKRMLKTDRRCYRCTRQNHTSRYCKVAIKCQRCTGRHATSMCDPTFAARKFTSAVVANDGHVAATATAGTAEESKRSGTEGVTDQPVVQTHSQDLNSNAIMLQTVTAWMEGTKAAQRIRILFDGGSQRSFIVASLSKRLGCTYIRSERISIGAFGGRRSDKVMRLVRVELQTGPGKQTMVMEALEIEVISCHNLPTMDARMVRDMQLKDLLPVAEDISLQGVNTELLIGADFYWTFVTGQTRQINERLRAVETSFGWTLLGPVGFSSNVTTASNILVMQAVVEDVDSTVRRFWELEAIGITDSGTANSDNDETWEHFRHTVTMKNQRYEVHLPWKNTVNMKDNKDVALHRLACLTRRLQRNPDIMRTYDNAIREYLATGVAEKVEHEERKSDRHYYYMPHQAVFKEDRITTKVRIVFDAPSSTQSGESLNDSLQIGPNMNPDILNLLMNFRAHKIAMAADVEKAFLQILIRDEDRDALRFLWYETTPIPGKPLPPVETWRMTRVTFGTAPSTFLLAATIRYHLDKVKGRYQTTVEQLNNAIYVDDVLVGGNDIDEARRIFRQSRAIFQEASMNLRKWVSNSTEMQTTFEQEFGEADAGVRAAPQVKVLGLTWNLREDTLSFPVQAAIQLSTLTPFTKRLALQMAASVFDPLGFLAPFVIRAKIYFQTLWRRKVTWDDPLPEELCGKWIEWCNELTTLQRITIPRSYGQGQQAEPDQNQLHIFSDASAEAYGAVVYLRTKHTSGEARVQILMAKGRVAPLKTITIPKLELMAALLSVRLYKFARSNFRRNLDAAYFWTDSMIVLGWIHGMEKNRDVFVKNRVTEMLATTNASAWRHISGRENPADLVSRGISSSKLGNSGLWWKGPEWLKDPHPEEHYFLNIEEVPSGEERIEATTVQQATEAKIPDGINRIEGLTATKYSSYTRLIRITAWIFRYVDNLRAHRHAGPLGAEEVSRATTYWIKQSQYEVFFREIDSLRSGEPFKSKSWLRGLSLFLDEDGVLRLTGRVQESDQTYEERHPIILPAT